MMYFNKADPVTFPHAPRHGRQLNKWGETVAGWQSGRQRWMSRDAGWHLLLLQHQWSTVIIFSDQGKAAFNASLAADSSLISSSWAERSSRVQTCSDNLDTYLRDDTNKISQPCNLKRLHRILLTYRTGWDQTRLRLAAESDGTLFLRCGGSVTTHHSWDHLSLSKMINAWKIWKLILLFYKKVEILQDGGREKFYYRVRRQQMKTEQPQAQTDNTIGFYLNKMSWNWTLNNTFVSIYHIYTYVLKRRFSADTL